MNAMVVYTEKMEKMFLPLLWVLWICHYLWTHVPERPDRKHHEKLRRRFKKIHRKLKDLKDNYKMQYEHFTQLIDHVRTDLMDHVRKEMELRQMEAEDFDAPTYADHVTPSA